MDVRTGDLLWGGLGPSSDGLVIWRGGLTGWYQSPPQRRDTVAAANGGVLAGRATRSPRTVKVSGELVAESRQLWLERADRLMALADRQEVEFAVRDGDQYRLVRGVAEVHLGHDWDGDQWGGEALGGADAAVTVECASHLRFDAEVTQERMSAVAGGEPGGPMRYTLTYPIDWEGEPSLGYVTHLSGGSADGEMDIVVSGSASGFRIYHDQGVLTYWGSVDPRGVRVRVHRRVAIAPGGPDPLGCDGQWPGLRGTRLVLEMIEGRGSAVVYWRRGWV